MHGAPMLIKTKKAPNKLLSWALYLEQGTSLTEGTMSVDAT